MRYLALILLVVALAATSVPALSSCSCDMGTCSTGVSWGRRSSSFTIPLSLLSPKLLNVVINLKHTLHGEMSVTGCPVPCCEPGRSLRAAVDVILTGQTEEVGFPPRIVSVTGSVREAEVVDRAEPLPSGEPTGTGGGRAWGGTEDTNPAPCEITAEFRVPQGEVEVTLSYPFLPDLRLSGKGEVTGEAFVTCVCAAAGDLTPVNTPPVVSLPQKVRVGRGGEAQFTFGVKDKDGDKVRMIIQEAIPSWLTIDLDPVAGKGMVWAADDAPLATMSVNVTAYDLVPGVVLAEGEVPKPGQFYHAPIYSFSIEVVANRGPIAVSEHHTVSHGIFGPLRCSLDVAVPSPSLKARDPDLLLDLNPRNYGYLHGFRVTSNTFAPAWRGFSTVEFLTGLRFASEVDGEEVRYRFWYVYVGCEYPFRRVPQGTYTLEFLVTEYNPRRDAFSGQASSGWWVLTVNNKPPELNVSPDEVKVNPGETANAVVQASDPDGDQITLTQTSGPGSFARVEGVGAVSGTWSWTVPEKLRSFSTWVSFVAKDPFGDVGYGFLHIRTVTPPHVYNTTAVVRRGGRGTAWAYVHDPDSPWVSVHVGSHPGISVAGEVLDDPFAPGMGGFMVAFEVSADSSLCDGIYGIPFTVTDPDGNAGHATLIVHVRGNQPPQASGALEGTATVELSAEGAQAVHIGPIELLDPEGDAIHLVGLSQGPVWGSALNLLYLPAVNEGDLCRALGEGDVLVDEFSVLVRDARGAEVACAGGGGWWG